MFTISNPKLVVNQCKSGIIGSFPALNAREPETLEDWIKKIKDDLEDYKFNNPDKIVGPYAVNQICHKSNKRLISDMETCVEQKVPIIITSLRPPDDIIDAAHSYGGIVYHDVISVRHAEKAAEIGVDGLILVCAGAGGHAGTLSPFALVREVREFFDGPIALSGSISQGSSVLSAQAMGADFAYVGTRFIATEEANASEGYKQMIVESAANDIMYSSTFTGVHGNYLKPSVVKAGLDPDNLPVSGKDDMNFGSSGSAMKDNSSKAWKDIWGSGQGIGTIKNAPPVKEVVDQMVEEYQTMKTKLAV